MKILILLSIMLISISAFSQEKQFARACKKNTIEACEKFIKKFPDTEFAEEAAFKRVEIINTISSYESFLNDYPSGKFSQIAESKLCKLEYLIIEGTANIKLYKSFLQRYKY